MDGVEAHCVGDEFDHPVPASVKGRAARCVAAVLDHPV